MSTVPHVIEPAASGRAKCRACADRIERNALRFGERGPNPFGEGEATWWFHLICGACKRPEPFAEALDTCEHEIDERETVEALARAGVDQPRLARVARAERSASGRARCRHCRETIAKDAWRIALDLWEEGRFNPIGFIHADCSAGYFEGADPMPRIRALDRTLTAAQLAEVATHH
jgi:hypothetical protein